MKNLFVLAPMFFHKDVFVTRPDGVPALNLIVTGRAFAATAVFCLLAGAVYTINDLVDVEADRVHPVKRYRPIASGVVPEPLAQGDGGRRSSSSRSGWRTCSAPAFALVALVYFVENLAYTFKLKKVAFLDVGAHRASGSSCASSPAASRTDVHVAGTCSPARRSSRSSSASASAGTSSRSENAGKQRAALEAYTPRVAQHRPRASPARPRP